MSFPEVSHPKVCFVQVKRLNLSVDKAAGAKTARVNGEIGLHAV